MRQFRPALLWATTASLSGILLWSVLAGTVWTLTLGTTPLVERLRAWPWAILGSGYWATFIGIVAIPVYALVFGLWLRLVERRPTLEGSAQRVALATLGLSAPPVLALTHGFATGFDPWTLDWPMAGRIFPIALASCWGAAWLPRRLLRRLRPSGLSAAG